MALRSNWSKAKDSKNQHFNPKNWAMKRIDLSWPLVFSPKFAVECWLFLVSFQSDVWTTYRRYGDCFPYLNFFYKLLLLLEMSDYQGGKILFCWNRSKRSHETRGDLTGKAACLVDVLNRNVINKLSGSDAHFLTGVSISSAALGTRMIKCYWNNLSSEEFSAASR